MPKGRRLVAVEEFADIMATLHHVEGTKLHVVELLMFGFAYASRFIMLKARSAPEKLHDETVRVRLIGKPYRFGKKLEWGADLELDPAGAIFYIGDIAKRDLITGNENEARRILN
jgi:hypothetical protein